MKWFQKPSAETLTPSQELYAVTVMAAARLLSRLHGSTQREESLLELECRRAQGLNQPLSLLQLELADWAGIVTTIGPERATQTQDELALVLRGTLRATDSISPESMGTFTIFLPGTLAVDLPTITRNLRQAIRGYRILATDGAPFFLRLHPWIASASLPDDGKMASELTSVLKSRLVKERTQPFPALTETENDDNSPPLRLVA
ncbi:hypothetical protein [Armatimonas sp.]|uniref:hypothetical protein n=1 Tax=Armatimonas sp. TaxID=1872638 RepID=UPI00286C6CCE|nr:hypothetical protein [Armatimonas sp.]